MHSSAPRQLYVLEIREAIGYYNNLVRSIGNASEMQATPTRAGRSTQRRGHRLQWEEEAENSHDLVLQPLTSLCMRKREFSSQA